MRAVDIIRRKRDGHELTRDEIETFVAGVTSCAWPDYQSSALLMAIFLRGMNAQETADLTEAMAFSGIKLDLRDVPGVKVDKHSTGGVGDKTSLIIAPLVAACGVCVPMMSGRGLGHTGGTLDKLEAIPGFRVHIDLAEFRTLLKRVGCALIGQTKEIAPADRILYALRDVTGTVESIPLITASIMSKKIAEGIGALVLDVKCGHGAFMKSRTDARTLAESLVQSGQANGVKTIAVITAMDVPLGQAVGNSLEVIESLETLKGRGPKDLESLSVLLAGRMLLQAGVTDTLEQAEVRIRQAIASGAGLEKFRQIIQEQGGDAAIVDDYARLPNAPHRYLLKTERAGVVTKLHAELIGRAAMVLGAGRDRVEDAVDHSVGAMILVSLGQAVKAGDGLIEVHYRDKEKLEKALTLFRQACEIGDTALTNLPLVLETIE